VAGKPRLDRVFTATDVDQVIRTRQAKFRLLTVSDLGALPAPKWLINGLFELGALFALYGPSGDGKTFLVLDWLLSVAAGVDWMGRKVLGGIVVYVTGEGGRGIYRRVRAWMEVR